LNVKAFPPFVYGNAARFAILHSDNEKGIKTITDIEFIEMLKKVTEYAKYDASFKKEWENEEERLEAAASFYLRKVGSQFRWDERYQNLGNTYYLYNELSKAEETPQLIKEIVNEKFEEKFGVQLMDFLKTSFVLWAGSNTPGGMVYFDTAKDQGLPILEDEKLKKCFELLICDTEAYKKKCEENESRPDMDVYELNPLFQYPVIRPWKDSHTLEPKEDKFIAPLPSVVFYRFTTGLYYQLFDEFKMPFRDKFGKLFEQYVNIMIKWLKLSEKVIKEDEIKVMFPTDTTIPDSAIFCKEGIVLIEYKSASYSKELLELGLNAQLQAKGSLRQIIKGANQLNTFEHKIPDLLSNLDIKYSEYNVKKIIITYGKMHGLKSGFLRDCMKKLFLFSLEPDIKQYLEDGLVEAKVISAFGDNNLKLSKKANLSKIDEKSWMIVNKKEKYKIEDVDTKLNIYDVTIFDLNNRHDWLPLHIGELEAVQPFITNGKVSLWSFLDKYQNQAFHEIMREYISEYGPLHKESEIKKYEKKVFDELVLIKENKKHNLKDDLR